MLTPKHYIPVLNICFITLAAYLGVMIFYKAIPLDYTPKARQTALSNVNAKSDSKPPASLYSAIARRNLFKIEDKSVSAKPVPPTPPPPEKKNLKETRRKLKLWGTIVGGPIASYAVITKENKKNQELYKAGEIIKEDKRPDDWIKIDAIYKDRVELLDSNGKKEVLLMEKMGKGKRLASSFMTPPSLNRSASSDIQRISMDRAQIEDATNNINDLMKQARIRPHFKDGKPDGLVLSRVKRNSLFTKLGLRSGDIITGVNGDNIQSVDDALKFYSNLKSASNLNLQIRRRGQIRNLEYNIE